jgi:hypothetical protein
MKLLVRILLSLAVLLLLAVWIAYIDGKTLPVEHTASVTGTISAPPEKVFARIIDVAAAPRWRSGVKAVSILPPVEGPNGRQDHWIEDLGHGQTMTFLAMKTVAPTPPAEIGLRQVLLDVPGAAYGGTWTYRLAQGQTPGTTTLTITEAGFIHPPIYRFMMHHVLGMTYNLDQYLSAMKSAAPTL